MMELVIKLCSELSNIGEEYVLLTAGNEGNQRQLGSVKGRQFLQANPDLAQRFFSYCYNAPSSIMYMGGQTYGQGMDTSSMETNRNPVLSHGHVPAQSHGHVPAQSHGHVPAHQSVTESAASTIAGALQSLAAEFQMGRPQLQNPLPSIMPPMSGNIGGSMGVQNYIQPSQDHSIMSSYPGNMTYSSDSASMGVGNMGIMSQANICDQTTNSNYLMRPDIANTNFQNQNMMTSNVQENETYEITKNEEKSFAEEHPENKASIATEEQIDDIPANLNTTAEIQTEDAPVNTASTAVSVDLPKCEETPSEDEKRPSSDLENDANVTDAMDVKQFNDSGDSNFSVGFDTDFNFQDQQDTLKLVISRVVSTLDQEIEQGNQQYIKVEQEENIAATQPRRDKSHHKKRKNHKKVIVGKNTRQRKCNIVIESIESTEDSDDDNSNDKDYIASGNDSEATIVSDGESRVQDVTVLRGAAKRKAHFQCHRCGVCHKLFANSSNLRRHEKSHGVQGEQRKCTKCSDFVLISDMKKHLKVEHADDDEKQKLTCKDCGEICMSKAFLRKHTSAEHLKMKFECKKCKKRFRKEDSYKIHVLKHLNKHSCGSCSERFATRASLAQHMLDAHNSALPAQNSVKAEFPKCEICHRRWTENHDCRRKKNRVPKLKTIREPREYICHICNKKFSRIQNLNLHRKVHSDIRTKLKCDLCEKLFSDRCSLKKHIKYVHSSERNFVCDVCGKSFKQNDTLKSHVRIHAEEKTEEFKCELCEKLLSSKSALNVHKRSHTGAKPFMCEICGMSFRQVANMRKHMLIHTTAKSNHCDLCGKQYKYRDSWKAHMRGHVIKEGLRHEVNSTRYGKVYNCEFCQKQFSTASQYKVHLRTHTDERPFKCSLCEKAFKEKGKLSRHRNRVHAHSQMMSHPHHKMSIDNQRVFPMPIPNNVMYYTPTSGVMAQQQVM